MTKYFTLNYLKENDPELYRKVISYKFKGSLKEKVYRITHNITQTPICPVCGKPVKFNTSSNIYRHYCSPACVSRATRIKAKETICNNGGYKRFAEKGFKTKELRYGSRSYNNLNKSKQTCMEKYGVEWASQTKEFRDKVKQTCMEKYGVSNCLDAVRDEIKKGWLEKYGVDNPMKNQHISNQARKTLRKNIIAARNFLIGYTEDGDWICSCPHPECNKCDTKQYTTRHQLQWDRMANNQETCTILSPISPLKIISTNEIYIGEYIKELGYDVVLNDRTILSGKELDIYIPEKKIAIEVNGCYWHSVNKKDKTYHMSKFLKCMEKGIRLITLWDDWKIDDIKNFLVDLLEENNLSKYVRLWFPKIDEGFLPCDLGFSGNNIYEHKCMHDKFECYDSGITKQSSKK